MTDPFTTPERSRNRNAAPTSFSENDPSILAHFREWNVTDTNVEHIDLSRSYSDGGGRYCAIIDGLLTEAECRLLIGLCEERNWDTALLNETKAEDIRKSKRLLIDDKALADIMYERIMLALAPDEEDVEIYEKRVSRMNNRFRFLKYTVGDYFRTHMDGSYTTPNGEERSMMTCQLYLNTGGGVDCLGGETNILGRDQQGTSDELKILYPVVPKTGRCLLFDHRTYHEGAEVTAGVKFAVRNELMYDLSSRVEARRGKKKSICAIF